MMTRMILMAMIPLAFSCIAAFGDDPRPTEKTISVSGYGKISAPPNVADITLGVVSQAKTAREALSANNAKMDALQKVLKERGVASKDLQTTNINVTPQYTRPSSPQEAQSGEFVPRIISYEVSNSVSVTVRDLSKVGELLDAVVTAGANQMHGIRFRIDEPDAMLDVARKKAMADAKKKAELMAGEAGVVVGFPITIRDEPNAFVPPYAPMMGRSFAMAAASPTVPVAAGEQELSVTVHVVYELKVPK
jgi:uncharacterized protein